MINHDRVDESAVCSHHFDLAASQVGHRVGGEAGEEGAEEVDEVEAEEGDAEGETWVAEDAVERGRFFILLQRVVPNLPVGHRVHGTRAAVVHGNVQGSVVICEL